MPSFDSSKTKVSLPEWARLYVLYMGVGVSAIPMGVVYGVLVVKGYGRWWAALLSIIFGLCIAKMTWKYVNAMFVARRTVTAPMGGMTIMPVGELMDAPISSEIGLDSALVALVFYGTVGPSSSYPRSAEGQSQFADEYAHAPHNQ